MKVQNIGLLLVGSLSAFAFVVYSAYKQGNPYAVGADICDTEIVLDSIPESKCYSKTIVMRGGDVSTLGSNPLVNHQVPTDYDNYSNNWDEELERIK